jgi:hypothetical protein
MPRYQIAELAGVSRQAVHKAIRAGHLVCGANGLIDPDDAQNAEWISLHRRGFDARVRGLDTYRWRGGDRRGCSKRPADDLDVLDADLDELLGHAPRVTDADISWTTAHRHPAMDRAVPTVFFRSVSHFTLVRVKSD